MPYQEIDNTQGSGEPNYSAWGKAKNMFQELYASLAGKSDTNHTHPYEPLFDPRTSTRIFDDFVGGVGVSGHVGDLGWRFAGGSAYPEGSSGLVGKLGRNTTTTANTYAWLRLSMSDTVNTVDPALFFDLTWRAILLPSSNSAACLVRAGLASGITDPPTDGIYFEKPTTELNWYGVCRSGGVESRTPIIAPTSANWARLNIRRIDAQSIGFSIDGGPESVLTTNVPTVPVSPIWAAENTDAADKFTSLDYFDLLITNLNR